MEQATLRSTHPLAALFTQTLDFLHEQNREAYVEVENGVITNVRIPEREVVWYLKEENAERVSVGFHTSAAIRFLRRDHAQFAEMHALLKSAAEKNTYVLVTTASNSEIVDVRALPALLKAPVLKVPGTEPHMDPVSPAQANYLFHLVKKQTCDPRNVNSTCIPFNYPADGCWIRAHFMARMIVAEKITPAKIWSAAYMLSAHTENDPNCTVSWAWHVAAVVLVKYDNGAEIKLVIDPSLAPEPVTIEAWIKLQTNPKATHFISDWKWYDRFGHPEAPDQAKFQMRAHRLQLIAMCEEAKGYPPYAQCKLPEEQTV
jgi:hypothetical protein